MTISEVKQWIVSADKLARPKNMFNEKLQYGFESFSFDYTNSERTKILKLHGHERIVDTPATMAATYELEYNCHYGSCSNCSGISCCAIFLPNQEFIDFEQFAQQHCYVTDLEPGIYDGDKVEVVWQDRNHTGIPIQGLNFKNEIDFILYDCPDCSWYSKIKPENMKCPECNTIVLSVDITDEPIQITPIGTGEIQPLNPNANAIKVIQERISELRDERDVCTHELIKTELNIEISALNTILKLLQS